MGRWKGGCWLVLWGLGEEVMLVGRCMGLVLEGLEVGDRVELTLRSEWAERTRMVSGSGDGRAGRAFWARRR